MWCSPLIIKFLYISFQQCIAIITLKSNPLSKKAFILLRHYCGLVTFMFQEVVHVLLIVPVAIITAAKVRKHYWNVLFPLNEFPYQLFPLWLPVVCFCRSICCSDNKGVSANTFPLHEMEQFILKKRYRGMRCVCWYKYSQDTQCPEKIKIQVLPFCCLIDAGCRNSPDTNSSLS